MRNEEVVRARCPVASRPTAPRRDDLFMAELLIVGSGVFGATLALELAETTYKDKADRIIVLGESLASKSAARSN